ncbi:hypothetical protein GLOIN_2v1723563, partial [Rhizophagus irregularis DAOM 181602=DAOM 197198]
MNLEALKEGVNIWRCDQEKTFVYYFFFPDSFRIYLSLECFNALNGRMNIFRCDFIADNLFFFFFICLSGDWCTAFFTLCMYLAVKVRV